MRVWEFEDNNAIPSDLVREQDFILRVRRLHRLNTPYLVVNLTLTSLEQITKHPGAMEAVHERLQQFAKVTNGTYCEMSNGDIFIIWEETHDSHILSSRMMEALFPDSQGDAETDAFLLTYHMPQDYTQLRERANHYVEIVRTAAAMQIESVPAQALQSAAASGPLTAWSADQMTQLLNSIDLSRYGRTQPIYHFQADGKWKAVGEEYFFSFEDLRRERFPNIDVITPEHLFLALCKTLDQRLLTEFSEKRDFLANRNLHLNVAVGSILDASFAQFSHSIPREKRGQITFELHRGDLLQDFAVTLNAMKVIRAEGFKIAIDSVTPELVNYVNFPAFKSDFIKMNVSKDRVDLLSEPEIRKGLAQLPADKLIFFRCDNEKALTIGLELGISKFQGWLIDDAVKGQT